MSYKVTSGNLAEADFADAIVEVIGPGKDFNFDAHEVDGEVAAVDFGKADGVFLGSDDGLGLAFLAAVNGVENFLLGEAMVVGEALGIDEFGAEVDQALLETFGLGDRAEGSDFAGFEKLEAKALAREDVFEVKRVVNAFDEAGGGVERGDAAAEFFGVAVAFGNKDVAGAGEVRGRFAQSSAREEKFVAEGLLAVDEDDVLPAAAELPVLKAVIEEEGVATELFDSVTATFDAVFVDEDDDVFEVGGEHVGFIAGHFGIEQEGFSVGDDTRGGGIVAEQDFIEEPLVKGDRFGAVAAGENGDVAPLVAEFAGKFLDDGCFAGAADREVANGDNLDAKGGIAEDAHVIKETTGLDGDLKDAREGVEEGADNAGAFTPALFENVLQVERLDAFCPCT